MAAVEAVTNAIRHRIERASDTIRVRGSISNNTVALMIDDDGRWRAPERNEDCGGYGLALMKALMTDIRVERRSAGTRVSLCRQLR